MGVSKNNGTPKSSILTGFSIINHSFWGKHPYFWKHLLLDKPGASVRWFFQVVMSPSTNPRFFIHPSNIFVQSLSPSTQGMAIQTLGKKTPNSDSYP